MSLSDDLEAMARAQSRREAAAREPHPVVRRRGRHRAPTPPFWALRPPPRHQRRVATLPTDRAKPAEHVER